MKHYDYVEWLLYKNKALSSEKLEEMEEHLYNCDLCMDIFLSLIDVEEIKIAEAAIPEDFTNKVMNKISKSKVTNIKQKDIHKKKSEFYFQFGIYAAVASVTILLSLGGFFTNFVDAVPKISASIEVNEEGLEQNLIVKLSDRIINSTSGLISRIENNQ
ncbi:hypothetical protein [Tissierella sp. Yu-01]|uniref:hypothetical protein n=1 Tax=Tissierella sp. Yu-01 TaxID=3035694 RepID=UPI00240D45F0|nr:hypothetical protein [Tissierella sp. Yu-01]WFA08742.1 hypothetical protein P3962_13595 [Tissierella sp. Yu-01]